MTYKINNGTGAQPKTPILSHTALHAALYLANQGKPSCEDHRKGSREQVEMERQDHEAVMETHSLLDKNTSMGKHSELGNL